jgi:SAM-dependent methyltransferase
VRLRWRGAEAIAAPPSPRLEGRDSQIQIHKYWRAPDDGSNQPEDYLDPKGGKARSEFLLSLIDLPRDASILEVGCNVGRNLNHLHEAGYTDLTGIELSEQAVEVLRREFPHLTDIRVGAAEDILPTFDRFDLVFTMAVLVTSTPRLSRPSSASWPGPPRS